MPVLRQSDLFSAPTSRRDRDWSNVYHPYARYSKLVVTTALGEGVAKLAIAGVRYSYHPLQVEELGELPVEHAELVEVDDRTARTSAFLLSLEIPGYTNPVRDEDVKQAFDTAVARIGEAADAGLETGDPNALLSRYMGQGARVVVSSPAPAAAAV